MPVLKREDAVEVGVPAGMRDRYVVRITEAKCAPNSKGNPMLTLNCEIAGVPTKEGVLSSIKRGGRTYEVAGLKTSPVYLTLAGKGLTYFFKFQRAAELPEEVDTDNFDTQPYIGKCMEAVVNSREEVKRKILTQEDRDAGKVQGDPILDNNDKPLTQLIITVEDWLCPFTGELPF